MGNNSVPKFIFRFSSFPVYRGSVLGRVYCILILSLSNFVIPSKSLKNFICARMSLLYPIIFFFENRVVYEIVWKNIVELDRPQMTIWHMRIACWIPKAT